MQHSTLKSTVVENHSGHTRAAIQSTGKKSYCLEAGDARAEGPGATGEGTQAADSLMPDVMECMFTSLKVAA